MLLQSWNLFRIYFFIFSFLSVTILNAQETIKPNAVTDIDSFDIRNASFLLPQPLKKGKFSQSLSIYYVVPPRIWTLDMVNAPMLNYSAKYTLPKGFNLQGGISTLFISNRINAGPFWNYSKDHLHLGIGYQVAFNLGVLQHFGYKTILTGWEQQPSVTFGYSFKQSSLIVRTDLYYTTSLNLSEGGHVIPFNENFLNGYSVTTSYEQRLHKKKILSMGLKINYLRYHILAWPALPVNSYHYYFPEFQLGIHL